MFGEIGVGMFNLYQITKSELAINNHDKLELKHISGTNLNIQEWSIVMFLRCAQCRAWYARPQAHRPAAPGPAAPVQQDENDLSGLAPTLIMCARNERTPNVTTILKSPAM